MEKLLALPAAKGVTTTLGDWIDLQTDPELIDTSLSQEGINQCQEAAKALKDYKFDVIFVSPLRRCLQTAHYLFKDNPHFPSMHFIIHEDLREKLHVSADLLSTYDLTSVRDTWTATFAPAKLSLHHTFKNKHWVLESL